MTNYLDAERNKLQKGGAMNAYGLNEAEAYDEAFDEFDEAYDEAFDEAYDEARRGARRAPIRPISVPRAGNTFQPRATTGGPPVTQAQLRAALARVSQQINTNAKAIKVVDGRVRGVANEQTRLTVAVRKETVDRKASTLAVRKDLQATREASIFLPLIASLGGGSSMAAIAPLLVLGNDVSADPTSSPTAAATTSGSGGFLGLAGNNSMVGLVALLALTGGLGKKSG